MKTKKLILSMFVISLLAINCFAKEKLSWGMNSKKIKKKVTIEKSYSNDFCEILYLPKNSVFNNEYDEYLLFTKEEGLISRLQKTNMSFDELVNLNITDETRELYESSEGTIDSIEYYLKDKIDYFQDFPSENSLEVVLSIGGFYNYITTYKTALDYRYEEKRLINFNNHGYIMLCYSYSIGEVSDAYPYPDFKRGMNVIHYLENNFEQYVHQEHQRENEIGYSKNPGPFGTWWGMKKSDMPYCTTYFNPSHSYGNDFAYKEFEKIFKYDYREDFLCTNEFIPKDEFKPKTNNIKNKSYTAIFDKNTDKLIQIICVICCYTSFDLKSMGKQIDSINANFEDIKSILLEKYGEPQDVKNRGEDCLIWKEENQNVELIKNNSIYDTAYGGALMSYVWLVYSVPDYEAILESNRK